VGPDELDPAKHYISIDSVLGRALLGKALDAEVTIQTPSGEKQFCILDVAYAPDVEGS
jgi:transcription elongation factor GreB